ncbi:MAG: PIN domain-containing protein [Nitrospirales bacterium]|nr:PIN domain-containing protein [Nitrospira sp.]MDR4499848.1 PIN domain-containing protein [Nitrospirales bacterium]
MTILVDTSVWSLALRKDGPADHLAVKKLQSLLLEMQDIVLIGIILQEILQGFRQENTFTKVSSYLNAFPLLPLNRSDYVAAAKLRRQATAKGLTLSTPDCQIASVAINHQCRLLTTDKDFSNIAKWALLQLL